MNTNLATKNQTINSQRLQIAHNALATALNKPVFFIERAVIIYDKVHVTYINEADLDAGRTSEDYWKDAAIEITRLEAFMIDQVKQAVIYNDINLAMYVDQNVNTCVKAYLEAGKEIIAL